MFEDSAIVRWYSYIDGSSKLLRINYSVSENGDITLGDVNEVHIVYEDVVDTSNTTSMEETGVEQATETTVETPTETLTADSTTTTTEETTISDTTYVKSETVVNAEDQPEVQKEKVADAACDSEATQVAQVSNAEVANNVSEVSQNNETTPQTGSGSASLTESERAEFEALKRAEKVTLVDSFKESLSKEDYTAFMEKVDSLSKDELNLELLEAYKKSSENSTKSTRVFAFTPVNKNANKDSLDSWVERNL